MSSATEQAPDRAADGVPDGVPAGVTDGVAGGVVGRTHVDGVDVLGSLSPSRAGDFLTCPLLFRFRTVDGLTEPPSPEAVRGTVVHKVLEELFDLPPADRTRQRAAELVVPAWESVLAAEPGLAALFPDHGSAGTGSAQPHDPRREWLASCEASLAAYFALEDPTGLEPAEREAYVETILASRLLLRGFVDRLDVNPDGDIRIVDYKTGRAPAEGFEGRAMFQMRFYALVIWRTRGVLPRMLQLLYLGSGEVLRYCPDEQDLLATERKVEALWQAIELARRTGDWRPHRNGLCGRCAHRALCPEWGGTPPPLPVVDEPGDEQAPGTAAPVLTATAD